MMSEKYYNIDFTPAIGCYHLNIVFGEDESNEPIPIYKFFIIFPLINDQEFLNYIVPKRTEDLSKIITDYIKGKKTNDFWIEYNIKYFAMRKHCLESLYFGLTIKAFKLSTLGIRVDRFLLKEIPTNLAGGNKALKKLGRIVSRTNYKDLIRIMKVGESDDTY